MSLERYIIMKKNALQFTILIIGYSLFYFIVTTTIYFFSMSQNSNGISLSFFGGGDDGKFYYEQATSVAKNIPYVYTSIHALILGWLLKIFNTDSVYLLRFFNYFANLGLLIISLLLLKKVMSNKQAFGISSTILIVILVCYPSLLLNTTLSLYRDVWIYVYFLWSIYLFSNIFIVKEKFSISVNALLLIYTMFMLGGYRKYALLCFLAGSLAYLVMKFISRNKISLKKFIYIVFIGFTVFYLVLRSFKFPIVGLSFSDVLLYRQTSLEIGGSQMGISLEQSNIVLFYINYLYSIISNLIGPLPWQISGVSTLFLMISEGIVFLIVLLFLYRRRRSFSNLEKYFLIQSIIWFILIGISNDNFGTGSRLRIVGWLPLLILFSKYYGEYLYNKLLLTRLSK